MPGIFLITQFMKCHKRIARSTATTRANAWKSVATGNTYEKEFIIPTKYAKALVMTVGRFPEGRKLSRNPTKALKMVSRKVTIILLLLWERFSCIAGMLLQPI